MMTANTTASARRPLVPTVVRVVISAARSGMGYSIRFAIAERLQSGFLTKGAAPAQDRVPAAGRRPVRRVRLPEATPRARMPGETGRHKPGCLGTIERATINRVEVG
jgi:hypothetical protein